MTEAVEMLVTETEALEHIRNPRFPMAAEWDPTWQLENMMGTNPLGLTDVSSASMPKLKCGYAKSANPRC